MTMIFINNYHTILNAALGTRRNRAIARLGETLSGLPHFIGRRATLRNIAGEDARC